MKKMRVCVVTGTRAEFGIWRPVLAAIRASEQLELRLVVTGMHLDRAFGLTVKDIEKSGFPIDARVRMHGQRIHWEAMGVGAVRSIPASESLARGIRGMGAAFGSLNPQIVLVLGDRLEMLAAASAALAQRIPIGHVHGGETAPGIWDEQIRHAITKMAHVHFCATETARRRIIKMGENRQRVHRVGAPALDLARAAAEHLRPSKAMEYPKAVLLLHPSTDDAQAEERRCGMLVRLLQQSGVAIEAIGPNNDPGSDGIWRAYESHAIWKRNTREIRRASMPQDEFWQLLASSSVLIGNSSSGIIEAASFGIPVINVGERQAGRERNANVLDVPWKEPAIEHAFKKATTDRTFLKQVARRKNLYGDGHASARIVDILEGLATSGIGLEKRFFD